VPFLDNARPSDLGRQLNRRCLRPPAPRLDHPAFARYWAALKAFEVAARRAGLSRLAGLSKGRLALDELHIQDHEVKIIGRRSGSDRSITVLARHGTRTLAPVASELHEDDPAFRAAIRDHVPPAHVAAVLTWLDAPEAP
jgi:hypothetical protein